jgi:CRISPR/Cas system CSM-associated protein Csm3 (group 7 of RAMP superfamily)
MKLINKTLISLTIVSSSLIADDISIDSIGINIGKSYSNYSQTDNQGSIILTNKANTTFNNIELYATLKPIMKVCKDNNIKPYISYNYSLNDDFKHQYLLTGINKYHNTKDYKLYAGGLFGYGDLKWRYNPLNTSKDNDYSAQSFIIGLQCGVQYPLNTKWSINTNIKTLAHNYQTNLEPSNSVKSTIEHKYTIYGGVGVSYNW